MESKNQDFETQGERHERKSKLAPQMRQADTRARKKIKKLIGGSYDKGFLCSTMRMEAKGAIYDIKSKKLDFETHGVRYEGKSKLVPQTRARE